MPLMVQHAWSFHQHLRRRMPKYEKDMRVITHVRAIWALQDAVADYENTISPFRDLVTPFSIRSLSTVTKVLYRDVLTFPSSPRVVDLSIVNDPKNRGGWISQKKTPHHQLWERTLEAQRLKERLNGLRERTSNMAVARSRSVANGIFGLR